ncbi:MAG: DUF423 domain-containing protein [Kastovskya adunca ATA6-11-RM4]|nr:DUF423 domain-containing protein [Kastovskya adunca ATA6-11-RM4]
MTRFFLALASLFAGLSVAAGAFASHALKAKLSVRSLEVFETGAKYQMYHALALLFVVLLLSRAEAAQGLLTAAGFAFVVGILIFSGSLYALALTGNRQLGAITPLGGVAFLVGWGCLFLAAFSYK